MENVRRSNGKMLMPILLKYFWSEQVTL